MTEASAVDREHKEPKKKRTTASKVRAPAEDSRMRRAAPADREPDRRDAATEENGSECHYLRKA